MIIPHISAFTATSAAPAYEKSADAALSSISAMITGATHRISFRDISMSIFYLQILSLCFGISSPAPYHSHDRRDAQHRQ